jgi:hypothetical protein
MRDTGLSRWMAVAGPETGSQSARIIGPWSHVHQDSMPGILAELLRERVAVSETQAISPGSRLLRARIPVIVTGPRSTVAQRRMKRL